MYQYGLGVIINDNPNHLHLAEDVSLDGTVDLIHNITIEKDAFFGHDVSLYTGGHDYMKFGQERKGSSSGGDIIIEEGVWICSKAIIIGPCRIGRHSAIGAGSVVSKDIPPYQLWAGNPARFIKEIPHE